MNERSHATARNAGHGVPDRRTAAPSAADTRARGTR